MSFEFFYRGQLTINEQGSVPNIRISYSTKDYFGLPRLLTEKRYNSGYKDFTIA